MVMKIINKITNTEPLILHAYGASHFGKKWEELCNETIGKEIKMPDDITIISFFFGDKQFSLREQLLNNNIPFIDAAKDNFFFVWQDRTKIKLIADSIKNVKTKYVLILDGVDVLLGNNIENVLEKFKTLDCKLLYNACVVSHPLHGLENNDLGIFNKLNSGAFIGETDFVELFYNDVMNIYDDVNIPVPHTDGIRISIKSKDYPEVKVDYDCEIFQTLLGVNYEFNDEVLTVTK